MCFLRVFQPLIYRNLNVLSPDIAVCADTHQIEIEADVFITRYHFDSLSYALKRWSLCTKTLENLPIKTKYLFIYNFEMEDYFPYGVEYLPNLKQLDFGGTTFDCNCALANYVDDDLLAKIKAGECKNFDKAIKTYIEANRSQCKNTNTKRKTEIDSRCNYSKCALVAPFWTLKVSFEVAAAFAIFSVVVSLAVELFLSFPSLENFVYRVFVLCISANGEPLEIAIKAAVLFEIRALCERQLATICLQVIKANRQYLFNHLDIKQMTQILYGISTVC